MTLDATLPAAASLSARVTGRPAVTARLVPTADWDAATAGFDGACQEQLVAFAAARWPGVALEPLLFESGGRVVGGCLVMVQPLPLRLGRIAVAKWGPMLADERAPDARQIYAAMIAALVAEYAERRAMMLSVLPRAALGDTNHDYAHLLDCGFRPGARLLFPDRYLVNLRLDDAALRKCFPQKWRYHLTRAEKSGLAFEVAGPDRLGEFDALYAQMLDRKRFPDHSAYETVPALMRLPEPVRPRLFFVRKDGEIVAGAIIFAAGRRAVYLYGATSDAALDLRAGYFLHFHIIRWLRDSTGADWYDLGGTDGFAGLHQFKKGMVGERGLVVPVPPVANYAAHFWPRLVGETAFAGREAVHALGRIVNRLRPDRAKPDQQRTAR